MKLTKKEREGIDLARRRPYGEIKRVAKEEGISYTLLQERCRKLPTHDTRELARMSRERFISLRNGSVTAKGGQK